MCGLAGIYNFRSLAPAGRAEVERMTRILIHRGPDDEGFYFAGALGLGHRRLSILDLSERGHQPMCTADGRFVIAYNGEIYNYLELRKDLEADGYVSRTGTDTEIILALYARKGTDCLQYLNGMFALAIWDSTERTLFLARDRVGIKPLYYAETADGIVFASEIKSLFASQRVSARVLTKNIDTYLTFSYVPGVETLFQGVFRVLPGQWLQISPKGIKSALYWDLTYAPNLLRNPQETAEELRELLLDAMRIHLRSDVPVGVFLSGGLDSSATVALLAEAGIRNLKTFSVAHQAGAQYDETAYAQLVADRFRTDHHVLYMDPKQFLDCISQFIWYMDEPVAEAPAVAFYLIAKLLRKHVTVALSGEGADELFAGYAVYRYMHWVEAYTKFPRSVRSLLEPVLKVIGTEKLRKYIRLAHVPVENRYRGVSNPDLSYKDTLYTNDFVAALATNPTPDPFASYYSKINKKDILTQMLYIDLRSWLVDDLLIKADRMTMANSVELRVPFLDYRVIEYAATIPSNMKLRSGVVKWILKRAMKGRLPHEILTRKKMGFPTPLALMFQRDLSDYLRDLLLSETCLNRQYFKRSSIERLIEENARKSKDHHRLLWQLVVLEEWHRQFIDQNHFEAPLSGHYSEFQKSPHLAASLIS
jgi:asparagine synthase (glutamine-hydrolysing)